MPGGRLSFADFLDVMHTHSKKERVPGEIVEALAAWPGSRHSAIPTRDLRHILTEWGEKLDEKELERLFREANVESSSFVDFDDFIRIIAAPAPDY